MYTIHVFPQSLFNIHTLSRFCTHLIESLFCIVRYSSRVLSFSCTSCGKPGMKKNDPLHRKNLYHGLPSLSMSTLKKMANFSYQAGPNIGCAIVLDQPDTGTTTHRLALITQRTNASFISNNSARSAQPHPKSNHDQRPSSLALSSLIMPYNCTDSATHSTQCAQPFSWTVFWDIENVCIPGRYNGAQVSRAIVNTLMHIRNRQTPDTVRRIIVFVNTNRMPVTLRNELQSNGVLLYHVETKHRKDAADKCLITELCLTARDLRPPAGICLLSGDQDFAYPLACIRGLGFATAVIAPNMIASSPLLMNVPDYVRSFEKDVMKNVIPARLTNVDGISLGLHNRKGNQASKSRTPARANRSTKPHTVQIADNQSATNATARGDTESGTMIQNSSKSNEAGTVILRMPLITDSGMRKVKRVVLSIATVFTITSSSCCLLAMVIRDRAVQTCVRDILKQIGLRFSTELLLMVLVAFPLNLIALSHMYSTSCATTLTAHQPDERTVTHQKRVQPYRRKYRKGRGPSTTLKNPPNL